MVDVKIRHTVFIPGVPLATSINFFRFTEYSVLFRNVGLVLAGALLAFMLEFSEFLLVCQTSSLTLSIAGIFKVGFIAFTCTCTCRSLQVLRLPNDIFHGVTEERSRDGEV